MRRPNPKGRGQDFLQNDLDLLGAGEGSCLGLLHGVAQGEGYAEAAMGGGVGFAEESNFAGGDLQGGF